MDSKGDNLIDENSAKKKFKFKSFKKFFGIKKRKETLPSLDSSVLKQSQSASDVTVPDSMLNDYDSEDDVGSASVLGSRAVSHDSIFIPEVVQESTRPIRVFSQENVSDRIKALQLKVQSNIKIGPPPFGLLSKRTEDPGTSSEDDGLPRSPPEISLIHDAIKTRFSDIHRHHSSLSLGGTGSEEDEQISSETSSRPLSPEETEQSGAAPNSQERRDSGVLSPSPLSPSADFSTPAQLSTCLDNSAARHRLSVRPRNQRTSKFRRPSAAFQEDSEAGLNSMEEEEVTALNPEMAGSSPEKAPNLNKNEDVSKNSDISPSIDSASLTLVESKQVASEMTVGQDPQTPGETQSPSHALGVETTITPRSKNTSASNTILREEIKVSDELMGRSKSKPKEKIPNEMFYIVKDASPISHLPSSEKEPIKTISAPSDDNGKQSQQTVVPVSRTTTPSQESMQSRSRPFRLSLTERSQNTPEQSQSDKENKKVVDKKEDSSPTETNTQRKFSVSSAWERPRTNSFTQKAHVEGDAPKNTKLSVLKPGVSRADTLKEDKTSAIQTENKHIGRRKESLADPEAAPSEKAIPSNVTSNQSAMPAASDLSVPPDSQAVTEDKNPFFKLRLTSVRNRDGTNPVSTTVKRNSAELKQEKTGCLTFSKDEISEAGPTDLSASSKSEMKCKADSIEATQAKPPLPRKPVLQNITVTDNNSNKEEAENVSSEEKKSRSTEVKTEMKTPERKLSVHKSIEKSPAPVTAAESGKGVESKVQQPSWMSMARQKQLSFKEKHSSNEQRAVSQEVEKKNKEKTEVLLKPQNDQSQNKTSNTTDTVISELYEQETKSEMKEPRQRANTLPHPVPGTQLSLLTDKEEKGPYKRQTLSISEAPSWMELAKKKSQAWSDMPQIIK